MSFVTIFITNKQNKKQTIETEKAKTTVFTIENEEYSNNYNKKLKKELEGYKSNFDKDKYLNMLNNL